MSKEADREEFEKTFGRVDAGELHRILFNGWQAALFYARQQHEVEMIAFGNYLGGRWSNSQDVHYQQWPMEGFLADFRAQQQEKRS